MSRWVSCGLAITTASTLGSATSTRQSAVARAKPNCRAFSAAPCGVVVQIISSEGLSAVSNNAATADMATAWALPM